jgi:hypothetical protein
LRPCFGRNESTVKSEQFLPSITVDESEQAGALVQTMSEDAADAAVKPSISADKSTSQTGISNPHVLNATPLQEKSYESPPTGDSLVHHLEDSSSIPNAKEAINSNDPHVVDSNFLSELPKEEDLSDTMPPSETPTVTDATDPGSSKVIDTGDSGLLPGSPRAKIAAPDPKIARGSPKAKDAADPSFLGEFFQNSRLHHISTMGANAKVLNMLRSNL